MSGGVPLGAASGSCPGALWDRVLGLLRSRGPLLSRLGDLLELSLAVSGRSGRLLGPSATRSTPKRRIS
eukprot:6513081-Pyramimonas_sp.AAC.1